LHASPEPNAVPVRRKDGIVRRGISQYASVVHRNHISKRRDWLRLTIRAGCLVVPPPPLDRQFTQYPEPNLSLRAQLACLLVKHEINRRDAEIVAVTIPTDFLEGFRSLPQLGAPDAFVGTPPWLADDRTVLAGWVEGGASVFLAQHGGGYCQTIPTPNERYERGVSETFVNWWQELDKLGHIPSLRLMISAQYPQAHESDMSTLLWATAMPTTIPKIQYDLINRTVATRPMRSSFWSRLDKSTRKRMVVRRRPEKFGNRDAVDWFPPEASVVVNNTSFPEAARHAGLVVVENVFATPVYECFSMGVPLIAYGERPLVFSSEFEAIGDALKDMGIFHDGPESAADMVNRVHLNPGSWWLERQDAIYELMPGLRPQAPKSAVDHWGLTIKELLAQRKT
jgi:putative transferase (TIGR04331 family)